MKLNFDTKRAGQELKKLFALIPKAPKRILKALEDDKVDGDSYFDFENQCGCIIGAGVGIPTQKQIMKWREKGLIWDKQDALSRKCENISAKISTNKADLGEIENAAFNLYGCQVSYDHSPDVYADTIKRKKLTTAWLKEQCKRAIEKQEAA